MKPGPEDLLEEQVRNDQVLFKPLSSGEEPPLAAPDGAISVEDQLILTPDHVHVGDHHHPIGGPHRKHPLPRLPLSRMIRGGVDVHYQLRPPMDHGEGRPCRVKDVLTDGNPYLDPPDEEDRAGTSSLEVTFLIEDPIIGKVGLVIDSPDLSPVDDGSGVIEIFLHVHEPDDQGDLFPLGVGHHLLQGLEVILDESWLQQKVFRGITGYDEFGEGEKVHPPPLRLRSKLEDLLHISGQIPHRRVYLGKT